MKYTEDQVRMIIAMVISWCEEANGNGINDVPIGAIMDGVAKGKDPGDGNGPSGYGYFDKACEWERDYRSSKAPNEKLRRP